MPDGTAVKDSGPTRPFEPRLDLLGDMARGIFPYGEVTIHSGFGSIVIPSDTPALDGFTSLVIPISVREQESSSLYAIKFPRLLRADELQRFSIDREVMQHIRPVLAPKVFDSGEINSYGQNVPWMIIEFLPGETPRFIHIHKEGLNTAKIRKTAAHIIQCTAQTLNSLHQRNIVYRDYIGHNVMINLQPDGSLVGNARVFDFGNAVKLDEIPTAGNKLARGDIDMLLREMTDPSTFIGEVLQGKTMEQFISNTKLCLDIYPTVETTGTLEDIEIFARALKTYVEINPTG